MFKKNWLSSLRSLWGRKVDATGNLAPARRRSTRARLEVQSLEERLTPANETFAVNQATVLAVDTDSDGVIDPGETVATTVTITNNSDNTDALGVQFAETLSGMTLVPGSINVSPLAFNDSYTAVGNTLLRVGGSAGSGPEKFIAGGSVTANDTDFTGTNFNPAFDQINGVTPIVNGTSTQGGTVNMGADGAFTYLPAAGFTGVDTFTYTVTDGSLTDTGTVTITVSGKVWYVNSAAVTNGDGRSSSPFNTLSAATVNGAGGSGDVDAVNDVIYVFSSATNYTGGIVLEAGQRLVGGGVALVVGGDTLRAAGSAPTLVNSGGNAITLANVNTIDGLNIGTTSGNGIRGDGITSVTVGSGVSISNVSGFDFSLFLCSGAVNFGATINDTAGGAIDIAGFSGAVTLSGNITSNVTGANPVVLNTNTGATINFTGNLSLTASGAPAFSAFGGGTINVATAATTSLSVSGNSVALSLDGIGSSTGIFFDTVNRAAANNGSITLTNFTGAGGLTIGAGTMTNNTGTGVAISGGSAPISIGANIVNASDAGVCRTVAISGNYTGSAIFSGNIDENDDGISITGLTSGAPVITFNGTTKTIDSGGNTAFRFTGNSGAATLNVVGGLVINSAGGVGFFSSGAGANTAINFTGGGLVINSGPGPGFAATGGTLTVTGSGNTITTTSAQVLSLDGVSIGGSGVTFATLKATGTVGETPVLLNNVDGAGTFNGGDVTIAGSNNGADGLTITGGSAATFTFGTVTIGGTSTAIADNGVELNGANGPVSFASLTVNNTGQRGVYIVSNTSPVTISGGAIGALNDPFGVGFQVFGGSGDVTVDATISKTTANTVVDVAGRSGGTVDFNGAISGTAAGSGIHMTGNTGGTVRFDGGITLSTLTTTAFDSVSSTGGTIVVTGVNTLTTTTGTALNVANTTIGGEGLTFKSITANGAASGIVLNTTGASGGLTVTGDSGSANNSSGGTIQNTTGAGISLNSTQNVSLDQMNLQNTLGVGISGASVTNFSFTNSTIAGAGNNAGEDGIAFFNLFGTNSITASSITNSQQYNLYVSNSAATASTLTIANSTFSTTDATNGSDAVHIESFTAGNLTVVLSGNNNLNNSRNDGLAAIAAAGPSTLRVTVNGTGSNFNGNLGSAVSVYGDGGAQVFALIENLTNVSTGTNGTNGGDVIDILANSGGPTINATIRNNTITALPGGPQFARGISLRQNSDGTLNAKITGNTISGVASQGIFGQAFAGTGQMNLIIGGPTAAEKNTITRGGSSSIDGILLQAGSSSPPESNTIRLNMQNNSSVAPGGGVGYRLNNHATTHFQLQDFTGSGSSAANITTWINSVKSNTGTTAIGISSPFSATAGAVPTPALPLLAAAGGVEAVSAESSGRSDTLPPTCVDQVVPHDAPAEASTVPLAPETLPETRPDASAAPAAPVDPVIFDDGALSQAELDDFVDAAIARWTATGLTAEQIAALRAMTFTIAAMPGDSLGSFQPGLITLDDDAAGRGWFLDATPLDDSEFGRAFSATRMQTGPSGAPAGHYDLLTTVMHEMGHALGLGDRYENSGREDLMYGWLVFGERRLPAAGQTAGAVVGSIDDEEFLGAPISIGTLPFGKTVTIQWQATINAQTNTLIIDPVNQGTASAANGFPDQASNSVTTPLDTLTLGGAVWNDNGAGGGMARNGIRDGTEPGITGAGGLALTLFADTGTTPGVWDASDAPIDTTTTSDSGGYFFNGLAPGEYIVRVDQENFDAGGLLVGTPFSPITSPEPIDPDNDVANDDNGARDAGQPAFSAAITLDYNSETTEDDDGKLDINDTLDFGFFALPDVSVAVGGSPAAEGTGSETLLYTFARSIDNGADLVVNFIVGGAAVAADFTIDGPDSGFSYSAGNGTITIPGGALTASFTVIPLDDDLVEGDQNVLVTVAAGSGYVITGSPASGVINDGDEATVDFVVDEQTVGENDAALSVTARLNIAAGVTLEGPAQFHVAVQSLGDVEAVDFDEGAFAANLKTITFAANSGFGATAFTTLDPTDDTLVEGPETLTLNLVKDSGASTLTIAGNTTQDVTLTDADSATVDFVLTEQTVGENDAPLELVARLNIAPGHSLEQAAQFHVAVQSLGDAESTDFDKADFDALLKTITFAASSGFGATASTTLDPTDDLLVEGDETLTLSLAKDSGATTLTVAGNTAQDVTIADADAATVDFEFTEQSVDEDAPSPLDVVVRLHTAAGVTLEAGATISVFGSTNTTETDDFDVLDFPKSVTFDAGDGDGDTRTVTFVPAADNLIEGDETAILDMLVTAGASTITIAGNTIQTVTIEDADSAAVEFTLADQSVGEDDDNLAVVVRLVALPGLSLEGALEVNVTVADLGDAEAADFNSFPIGMIFSAGSVGGAQKSVPFDPNQDILIEGDETLTLGLDVVAGADSVAVTSVGNATQEVTILDADFATVEFTTGSQSVGEEDGPLAVTVKINLGVNTLVNPVTFNVTAALGAPGVGVAAAGDFNSDGFPTSVVFPNTAIDGDTRTVFLIPESDDASEGDETQALGLVKVSGDSSVSVATSGNPTQVITIVDDDVDLEVLVSESSDPAIAGTSLVYTVTVTNIGLTDATGIEITNVLTLPAGVFTDSSFTATGSVGLIGSTYTWDLDLAAGIAATLTITLDVQSSAPAGGIVSIDSSMTDVAEHAVNTADDSDAESTLIAREIALAVSIEESIDPVVSGSGAGNLVYTITVVNDGPSDASDIDILADLELPAGVTFDLASPDAGSTYTPTTAPDGTWNIVTLAAGDSIQLTLTLTATASAPDNSVITLNASTTSADEGPIDLDSNSDTETTTVVPPRGTISGRVYLDHDGDGDSDAAEPGLAGRTVYLDANNDGIFQDAETSTTTDGEGEYSFPDQLLGSYTVRAFLYPTDESTDAGDGQTVVLASSTLEDVDLGVRKNAISVFLPVSPTLYTDTAGGSSERTVEAIYVAILGRPSDPVGKAGWVAQLNAGATVFAIAQQFLRSQEYAVQFVEQSYQQILGRAADAAGLATWTAVVTGGGSTSDVIAGLLLSPEYTAMTESSLDFATSLYRQILGREADDAAGWAARIDGGATRESVVFGFLNSDEARLRLIEAAYTAFYKRGGEPAGVASWSTFIVSSGASALDFLAQFLASDEFGARAAGAAG